MKQVATATLGMVLALSTISPVMAAPGHRLAITEVWAGNFSVPDVTPDWFEVTNCGGVPWEASVDGLIYFDDESADPALAVELAVPEGLARPSGTIQPGESVIFVDGGESGLERFRDYWGAALPADVRVGSYSNNQSALSNGGDTIVLWTSTVAPDASSPLTASVSYPSTIGFRGASFDLQLGAFSQVGNPRTAALDSPVPLDADSTVASPGVTALPSSGRPGFDLRVTEIWAGNTVGPSSTADWFEVTNLGLASWRPVADGDLYYDDASADGLLSVLLTGVDEIQPGESVIFVESANTGAAEFRDFWEPRVERSLKVGTFSGSGVSLSGTNGDAVNLWLSVGQPVASDAPFESVAFPPGANGASYDVQSGSFSTVDNEAGAIEVPRSGQAPEHTVASPGQLVLACGPA